MRIVSFFDDNGLMMAPLDGAPHNAISGQFRSARHVTRFLLSNESRQGKLPAAGDRITLRHVATNRLVALDHTNRRLWLSQQQTDHLAERFTALLTVDRTATRPDGLIEWTLGANGATQRVVALDHTIVSRMTASDGTQVRQLDTLRTVRQPGDLVTFHPVQPTDVLDLHTGQQVWLSMDGSPVFVRADERGRRVLRPQELPAAPLTATPLSVPLFRIDHVDRRGILLPDNRFCLRLIDSSGRLETVVVQDGQLTIEAGLVTTTSAAFTFSQLSDLDLYWNAQGQDNALVIGSAPPGYVRVRTEGRVLIGPRAGTVPLKQFYSTAHGDTMTTATVEGQEMAINAGYTYKGIVGWAYHQAQPHTRIARQYWHAGRRDYLLTATIQGERSAADYDYMYDDCHVCPPADSVSNVDWLAKLSAKLDPSKVGAVQVPVSRPGVAPVTVTVHSGTARLAPGAGRRPVRALVLSGGGAKGAFEAGAIQALWNDGYRPDIVCGVSVGAINAVKIAENESGTADHLVRMWREFSSDPKAIFFKELYTDLLGRAAGAAGDAARDTAVSGLVAKLAMNFLAPGAALVDLGTAAGAGLIASEASNLTDHVRRLINLAFMTHALHCMEPLRALLRREIRPEKIVNNRMRMRLGLTDVRTGCYFSVTEPFASRQVTTSKGTVNLHDYGRIDVEPDMAEGGNWLTQPAFGCDHYGMRLVDAAYASSTLPVFMEPLLLDLRRPDFVDWDGSRVALLPTRLPPGVDSLIRAAAPAGRFQAGREPIDFERVQRAIDVYSATHGLSGDGKERSAQLRRQTRAAADGQRGPGSATRFLFDGGLTDAIPIRTAIRMGATEILVIGVDQVGSGGARITSTNPISQYSWLESVTGGGGILGGLEPATLPAVQYLFAALSGFILGTTRGDLLAALGNIDNRRIGALASERLQEPQRSQFITTLRDRCRADGVRRRALLGGTTNLGGFDYDDYGSPIDGNIKVDVIVPDRPLLDSLGFADHAGVAEAIELGRLAARSPVSV